MLTNKSWIVGTIAILTAASLWAGEEVEPAKFYKLDFVIKELDGTKIMNSRAYSLLVMAGKGRSEVRTGSRVKQVNGDAYNLGVNIDAIGVTEVQNRLSFTATVEVSSIAGGVAEQSNNPIIRQNKWISAILLPFKKPTVVFSSDNLDSRSAMQVEVTATPVP